MVENLPDDYSTDNLQKIFGNVGKIVNITVHDPHSTEESAMTKKAEMIISNKLHALIEYETVEEAANAVATLNDEKNWRSGMRVEILLKWMGKYVYGRNRRGSKETLYEKNNNQSSEALSDVQKFKYDGLHDEKTEIEEDEHHAGGKGKRRGRYSKSQARGQQSANGQGHGHVPSGDTNIASKALPGPKMPDGTRGFAMGRGKPATAQSDPPHV
ncbi:la-related protein 6A [Iris pallida]|uniref:La-related protein 6A n=1 Tax=Iris pallida TaxID=29817 RepID=A0AAX6I3L6_IRIPA|nr:la-related protein 6A [Iris pallida]